MSRDSLSAEIPPPQRVSPVTGEPGVGMPDALRLLRERWRWVAGPTLVVFLAAVIFVQLVTPRYTGEAKILLESRDSAFTRPTQDRNDQPQLIDEQAVASQVQVAMSRDVAREAIKRLELVGNPEFDPLADGIGPIRRVLMMLGLTQNWLDRPPEDRILERYFDRLLVYPAGKSRILTIEFRSKDADLAAKGANVIAEVYLGSLEAAKIDTARSASTWLGTNIDTLRTRVAESEAKVEAFRARNGLFAGGGTTNLPIGSQQLSELSTQLSQARSAQADSAAKAKLIKELIKSSRTFEIPDVANNELIRRIAEQRINLKAQLALESRTLLPAHPRIKELNAQLSDLEGQIRAASDRIVRTLENDAQIAGSRVDSLQAAVEGQKDVVTKSNGSEVQLRALEREARVQRDQLESYLSRYREASARDAENAVPADARIVSRAIVPDLPSFPKKLPIVLFATLAAFVLSSGTIVGRRLLATPAPEVRIEPALREVPITQPRRAPLFAAVESALSAAAVVAVPVAANAAAPEPPPAFTAQAPAPRPAVVPDEAAGSYDLTALMAKLEGLRPDAAGGRLLVLGTGTGMDAGELADSLGATLARDAKTLVVALDPDPDGEIHPGLTDLVIGQAAFIEVIRPTARANLHRIAHGFADDVMLLREPQAMEITLEALDEAYGWTICCLADGLGEHERALAAMLGRAMDAIVIASNAPADDVRLVALYEAAVAAGAPRVIVARDLDARADRPGAAA